MTKEPRVEQAGRIRRKEEPVGRHRGLRSGEVTGDVDDEMATTLAEHVERGDARQQHDRLTGAGLAGRVDVEVAGVGNRLTEREGRPEAEAGLGCGEVDDDGHRIGGHACGSDIDPLDGPGTTPKPRSRVSSTRNAPSARVTRRPLATAAVTGT